MKRDTVFKRTANHFLDHVKELAVGAHLDPETSLASRLNVSRTTLRKIVARSYDAGLIAFDGDRKRVARLPCRADYFPLSETMQQSETIEKKFMEWMLRGDRKPGDTINGLDLARQFQTSPGAIRDYLARFSRLGLIEKRPNYGWVFRGFTAEFALELFTVRELFEVSSARAFASHPPASPAWIALKTIEADHDDLLDSIGERHQDFSGLDDRFHRLVNDASRNRFFEGFYDVISLIFHYHYQWNKSDELERNKVAVKEHKIYIAALFSRDLVRIEAACRAHLASARKTLLASIG